ncbi:ISAs1 family transposase [Kitasatospora sp. NPDC059648]|uniref:ISAs1 family transposase n=1 Tax=Kitasatospora sp. NPDC059648 TaxID=3346894 RepID=UPI0036C5B178
MVCPGGLAGLTGADPVGSDSIAVDGKASRGSRHGTSPAAHLLAAMTGDGRAVTQLRVPDKTNEITCFAALLEPYNLSGVTVTADALHAQRGRVRFLVEEKKAHYLLVVKANQPELHLQLRSLPWKDVTARRYDREHCSSRMSGCNSTGRTASTASAETVTSVIRCYFLDRELHRSFTDPRAAPGSRGRAPRDVNGRASGRLCGAAPCEVGELLASGVAWVAQIEWGSSQAWSWLLPPGPARCR